MVSRPVGSFPSPGLEPSQDVGEATLGHVLGGELSPLRPKDHVVELGLLPIVSGDPDGDAEARGGRLANRVIPVGRVVANPELRSTATRRSTNVRDKAGRVP